MIVSVSRRTDIPACYADWFLRRIAEGYALVRNPMNAHQVRRVDLSPEAVDGYVFWTKNPAPMLDKLDALAAYPYYFLFTLNPYGPDVEPGLPSVEQRIRTFHALSERIGRERVVWRYDPILITPKYNMRFHTEQFETLSRHLLGCTNLCIISFLDFYPKIAAAIRELAVVEPLPEQKLTLAARFAEIAAACGMRIETCAEDMDYSGLGIGHARCVDAARLARTPDVPLKPQRTKTSGLPAAARPVWTSARMIPARMAAATATLTAAKRRCSTTGTRTTSALRCCAANLTQVRKPSYHLTRPTNRSSFGSLSKRKASIGRLSSLISAVNESSASV